MATAVHEPVREVNAVANGARTVGTGVLAAAGEPPHAA
jgi:hypothetical protein